MYLGVIKFKCDTTKTKNGLNHRLLNTEREREFTLYMWQPPRKKPNKHQREHICSTVSFQNKKEIDIYHESHEIMSKRTYAISSV